MSQRLDEGGGRKRSGAGRVVAGPCDEWVLVVGDAVGHFAGFAAVTGTGWC